MSELVRDLPSENPAQLLRTQVGNKIVSTITFDDVIRETDRLIGSLAPIAEAVDGDLGERYSFLNESGDYESMVFACDEDGEVTDWEEVDRQRYSSEEDARNGHQELVEKYSNA